MFRFWKETNKILIKPVKFQNMAIKYTILIDNITLEKEYQASQMINLSRQPRKKTRETNERHNTIAENN